MAFRIAAALIATALFLAYVLPPAIKLKDFALMIVIGIGVIMMLIDVYQSLRRKD